MIVEKTNYGKRIKVWNDGYSDDWTYRIRNVKSLNADFERKHPIIDKLAEREAKLERKLLILLYSMENMLRDTFAYEERTGKYDYFDKWEQKNRLDFNRYYHDRIRELIEEIDGISQEYCWHATEDGYGWCF